MAQKVNTLAYYVKKKILSSISLYIRENQMSHDNQNTREFIDLFIAIGAWIALIYALSILLRRFVIPYLLT